MTTQASDTPTARPTTVRATYAGFPAALFAVLVVSLVSGFLPLVHVLGYESSSVLAALFFGIGVFWGAGAVDRLGAPRLGDLKVLRGTPWGSLNRALVLRLRGGLWIMAVPVLLAVVRQFLGPSCRVHPGLLGYALQVLPALALGLAWGAFLAAHRRGRFQRWFLTGLLVFATLVHSALTGYLGPRVVVHNLIVGFFSTDAYTGAGVDQELAILVRQRVFVLLLAAAFWAAAGLGLARRGLRRWPDGVPGPPVEDRLYRELVRDTRRYGAVLVGLVLAALVFVVRPDASGLGTGRNRLWAALSGQVRTERIRLHYSPGGAAAAEARRIAWTAEWWVGDLSARLGVDARPVDIWLYDDADRMASLTGARGFLFAQPWRGSLHVRISNRGVPALDHELVHVLAGQFGPPPFGASWKPGLVEGLAVALERGMDRHPSAHAEAAAALAAGHLPHAEEFLGLAGFGASAMRRSYGAAGSFCGFLLWRHGAEPMRRAYRSNDLAGVYGRSLAELDREWREFLSDVDFSRTQQRQARFRFDPERNPPFLASRCPRVGEISPDRDTRRLGYARWREGRWEEAADLLCSYAARAPRRRGGSLVEAGSLRLAQGDSVSGRALLELAVSQDEGGAVRAWQRLYRHAVETGRESLANRALENLVRPGWMPREVARWLATPGAGPRPGWRPAGEEAATPAELVRLLHPDLGPGDLDHAERKEAVERLDRAGGPAAFVVQTLSDLVAEEIRRGEWDSARRHLERIAALSSDEETRFEAHETLSLVNLLAAKGV